MSDEQTNRPAGEKGSAEAWREVGKQFEILGSTLAEAMRTSWYSEENRRRLQEMQGGLEKMVKEVGGAIKDASGSPQAEQAKTQARRTAETVRSAGEQTFQDIRPHLVSTLQQLNDELARMVNRMQEQNRQADQTKTPPPNQER